MIVNLSELFNPKGWIEGVWEERESYRQVGFFYLSQLKTAKTGHTTLKSKNHFDVYG